MAKIGRSDAGPPDIDSAERAFALRVFAWLIPTFAIFGAMVGHYFNPGNLVSISLALVSGILFAIPTSKVVLWGIDRIARGFVRVVTAAGEVERASSFSLQESLVVRGRLEEAARSY